MTFETYMDWLFAFGATVAVILLTVIAASFVIALIKGEA